MKKRTRLLALALVGTMIAGTLAGCGGGNGNKNKDKNSNSKEIEISYWESGLGKEWLEEVIKGFNEKHPEYEVRFSSSASGQAAQAALGLADTDTIDLYLTTKKFDTSFLEPLNDVLDTTVEGESKSIKEKFDPAYLAMEEIDGKYYTLTYGGGIVGLVYNEELFEQAGITQLPRTTAELSLVCGTLLDNNIKPTCHFNPRGYYHIWVEGLYAQYEGMDAYMDMYANPTKEAFLESDGRYEVLKVLEELVNPDNVLAGSNSDTHTTMQTKFLTGRAAMMVTGSWLSSEMSGQGSTDNFKLMKNPVISSIVNKLTTVKTEPQLRKLISAIDNVTEGKETIDTYKDGEGYKVEDIAVSAADWDYVYQARNTVTANYPELSAFIPNYSDAKEGAKEFLKYLYSDEGYSIYLDTLHVEMPLSLDKGEIDKDGWNAFEKSNAQVFEQAEHHVSNAMMNKHRLYVDGGADIWANVMYIGYLCANNDKDRRTADEVWKDITTRIKDKYDDAWMANIK